MVSVRRRKTQKSAVRKVGRSKKNRYGKPKNFGNSVIKEHWDDKLTLSQNYRKLGLTAKLGAATGGTEKSFKVVRANKVDDDDHIELEDGEEGEQEEEEASAEAGEEIEGDPYDPKNIPEGTAKILRDDDGNVKQVIYGTKKTKKKAKKEPKKSKEQEEAEKMKDAIVAEIQRNSSLKKTKIPKLNEMDLDIVKKLDAKYGEDFGRMKWDQKLNPFQYSESQLKKKFKVWHGMKQEEAEEA